MQKQKVLVCVSRFEERCAEARERLLAAGLDVTFTEKKLRELPAEEVRELIAGIDAAIVGMDPWGEEMFAMAPRLKVISRFGVGVDTIDLEGARRRRIYVTNAAGSNAQAVAELAVFLMLGVLRHGGELSHAMTEGRWMRRMGGELSGKTVGLIGFGEIGRRTAELVRAFGAEVIAYKRSPAPELAGTYGVTFLSREEVMENCDILSLHIPGTPDNYHMVNRETLARMRRGAILINTGRGSLVDEAALAEAVSSGQLAGAGLDVFEAEPLAADSPLRKNPHIFLLPHTGGETEEAYCQIGLGAVQGVLEVLSGREPSHWVNRW